MNDDVSLGFYNIKDENFIYLENIQQKTDESQVTPLLSLIFVENQGHCVKNQRFKQPKVPLKARPDAQLDQPRSPLSGWSDERPEICGRALQHPEEGLLAPRIQKRLH